MSATHDDKTVRFSRRRAASIAYGCARSVGASIPASLVAALRVSVLLARKPVVGVKVKDAGRR